MHKRMPFSEVKAMVDKINHYYKIHGHGFVSWAINQPDIFGKLSRRRMQDCLLIAQNIELIPDDCKYAEDALNIIALKQGQRRGEMAIPTQNPVIKHMIDQFCELYNCTWEQITNHDRHAWIVECRYLLMYYLFSQHRLTNSLIARMFNKDHTTVLHGIRKIKERMEYDVSFREYVDRMETLLDMNFSVKVEEIK